MVYINEWLPNPVGNDNAGEFIELYNSGDTVIGLRGYILSDGAKKTFSLGGYNIPANGYLILKKVQTKLSLKNTGGALSLYGPEGTMVDSANFMGIAPEGKSFSRADHGMALTTHFVFTYPTPGIANKTIDTTIAQNSHPFGVSLSATPTVPDLVLIAFGTASFFLLFFIYVTRNNRNISNLFFGRDAQVGI
jgi:hypothetical protein